MSRRILPLVSATALAVAVLAVPSAAQLPTTTSDVVLLDPGAEPREVLRYEWALDQQERLRSTMTVDVFASESGQQMMEMRLPVTITMDARVTEQTPNDTTWIMLTFDEMAFGPMTLAGEGVPDGAAESAAFDEVMDEVAPLLGEARMWQQIAPNGRVVRTNVSFPDGFPAEASAQLDQASNTLVLLPSEPVGVGARWSTTGTTTSQGLTMAVVSTMELVERDGDLVTLDLTVGLANDALDTTDPTNPFDELAITGGGRYELDLGKVFPISGTMSMSMDMGGDIPDGGGDTIPVEMQVIVDAQMDGLELE